MTTKQAHREHAFSMRKAMSDATRAEASRAITTAVKTHLKERGARHVAIFYPMRGELDLRPLAADFTVYLPNITDGRIALYEDTGAYVPGGFGTTVPAHGSEADLTAIDAIVVPGLCFDRRGYRIGYGKGYYDDLLSRYDGHSVGVCFADLVFDTLPIKPYDRAVDTLITERGTVKG